VRVFIISGWTLIALLTISLVVGPHHGRTPSLARPLTPADNKAPLEATVHFDGHEFQITNTGDQPWNGVLFTVVSDRAYIFEPASVAPHQRVAVRARSFASLRGNQRFNPGEHSFLTFGISATLPDGQEGLCLIGGPSL